MNGRDLIKLVVSIGVCQSAGLLGSLVTRPAIGTWYAALAKPDFRPPDWVFGPVWILLYFLMGVAAFLVWQKGLGARGVKIALAVFIVQLVFNTLWSFAFFGLQSPLLGLIDIALLWIAIVVTMVFFARVSTTAAWLMVPYLAWVTFAAVLNLRIWQMN